MSFTEFKLLHETDRQRNKIVNFENRPLIPITSCSFQTDSLYLSYFEENQQMLKLFMTLCVSLFVSQADNSVQETTKPVLNYESQLEMKNIQRMEPCFEWTPIKIKQTKHDEQH